ncbi:tol-pal system protein YbgF [Ideonella oryzae]|uniref:Cell division coordinator CpoB n=1 Tax=Ideonella oryzae TaxID=2937441 RepID=A0ABT1BIM2_9BURK|nr:tol-pal system protein YbgF [Ideonella oryzae]MCO5976055.1 tol-pal system protein YbgF [Ideonella oryzae]
MATRLLRPLMPAVLAACGLWLAVSPARAGLFDDDEARRAILDLRAKISQNEQLIKQQADQIQSLQNGLLDLGNQNEQLRTDLAKLRGQDEQMLRDMADLQRTMRDLQAGLNDRMRKLEPQPVTVDGKTFTVDPEEKAAFEDAMNSLRGGDFDRATTSLNSLLKRYPSTGYGDSARYWLGNAQYGQRDYKGSLATFKAFLAAAPDHPRAAEAMLAIANCQAELKDTKAAKRTLEDLIKRYPQSEAAHAAKERLVALK